jgi:membrane associated rhomboid family serine protease
VTFIKKAYENFISNDYSLIAKERGSVILSEDTDVLTLMKIEGSQLYIVSFWNLEKVGIEEYKQRTIKYYQKLERSNIDAEYSHVIVLNLLIAKNNEEKILFQQIEQEEFYPGQKIFIIPWLIDLKNNEIIVSSFHPDRILNIHELIQQSFKEEELNKDRNNLTEWQKKIHKKTALQVRSKDTSLTYMFLVLNMIIWLLMELAGGSQTSSVLIRFGANEPSLVLQNGQYWRLFTSMFLHIGLMHLLYNSFALYLYGTRVEKYFGKMKFLCIYILSGLVGSTASIFLSKTLSAGASGAIYGLLGAIMILTKKSKKMADGLSAYIFSIMIIVGLGLGFMDASIDNFAHIGGLITGILLGYLFL